MDSGIPKTFLEAYHEIIQLRKENESLRGHIRRLEKANEQLGLENHKLKGRGQGWNQNV